MKVKLKKPCMGYEFGELTGVEFQFEYEIRLPSGKIIYRFEDEFEKVN